MLQISIGIFTLHKQISTAPPTYIASKQGSCTCYQVVSFAQSQIPSHYTYYGQLKHSGILRLLHTISDKYAVFEYCDWGTVRQFTSIQLNYAVPEEIALQITRRVIIAYRYIHSNNITSRFITPDTIYLKHNFEEGIQPKISDFSYASEITYKYPCQPAEDSTFRDFTLYNSYSSPEIFKKIPYNYTNDIYSIGAVFYFMLFGRPPFFANSLNEEVMLKVKGDVMFYGEDRPLSQYTVDFIAKCLKLQNSRINMDEVLNHPIFTMKYSYLSKQEFGFGKKKIINVHSYY